MLRIADLSEKHKQSGKYSVTKRPEQIRSNKGPQIPDIYVGDILNDTA